MKLSRSEKVVVATLTVLLVPVIVYAGTTVYNYFTLCQGEKLAVFEEFPHYGSRDLEPIRDLDVVLAAGDICMVEFETTASEEAVISYYEENLRENSWEVEVSVPPPTSELQGPRSLSATRGDYGYSVNLGESRIISKKPSEPLDVRVSMGER